MTIVNTTHDAPPRATVAAIDRAVDQLLERHAATLRAMLAANAGVARLERLAIVIDADDVPGVVELGDACGLTEIFAPAAAAMLVEPAPAGRVWVVALGAHATVVRSWCPQREES